MKQQKTTFLTRTAMTLTVLLLTILALPTTAWAEQSGNWIYTPDATNGTCVITGDVNESGDADLKMLTIPKQLDGYWVTQVSDNALSGFTGLKTLTFYEDARIERMPKVYSGTNFTTVNCINFGTNGVPNTLPASITVIGNVFRGTGIKNLTMPGVTSIGANAFEGCNSLESVTFGQAVPIGVYGDETPFSKISSSCTVNYPGPMANWSAYNYQYSPKLVVNCTDGSCGWCGDGWGEGWTNNNNLYKDNSCLYWTLDSDGKLTIDCLAQDLCLYDYFSKQTVKTKNWDQSKVKSLRLERVYGIEFGSFNSLTSLSISKSVEYIRVNEFTSFPLLTTIVVDAENLKYDSRDGCNAIIDKNADDLILGCGGTSIIPSSVGAIIKYAFKDCIGLTSVTIPNSVVLISDYAFADCKNLANLYFDGTKTMWDNMIKDKNWNSGVPSNYTEHWRCTVTFDANGRGTAPDAQTGLWSNEAKATEPAAPTADGWRFMGWYTDAACTKLWHFDTDIVPGDMTLYAGWAEPCAVTASASETSIVIPYGQEWTEIPITVSSLTLGWFQNGTEPVRCADAVALTPFVGSGATSNLTFYNLGDGDNISAYKGAGEHTVGNRVSEAITATGQSGTLWVYIPQSVWESAAVGTYEQDLTYDAVFYCNAVTPAESYAYSLGNDAKVTLRLNITEPVTLQFDKNGGTGDDMAGISTRKGVATTLPACTFTAPDGKSFICWNTKADGTGERYAAGDAIKPAANTTLYAQWGEEYVIDLTTATQADVPMALLHQLFGLTGYFSFDTGFLDINLDGQSDIELFEVYDNVKNEYIDQVKKLVGADLLNQNYRFLLTMSGEPEEYSSVVFKFNSQGATVQQPAVVELIDDADNSAKLETLNGSMVNVVLSGRRLKAGWNTICLPFALTAEQIAASFPAGTKIKTLSDYSVSGSTVTVSFATEAAMAANKPYIIRIPDGNGVDFLLFRNVTISYADNSLGANQVTKGDATFVGTYKPVTLNASRWHLFLQDNSLYYPAGEVTVNACRAYFVLQSELPTQVNSIALDFDDATGIKSFTPDSPGLSQGEGSGYWYSLDGRKLDKQPTTKGLYIHNGRKVLVK